jgi:membrane associated rhomboid family serine protease
MKLLWLTLASLVLSMLPNEYVMNLVLWPYVGFGSGLDVEVGHNFQPLQFITQIFINPGVGGVFFIGLTLVFFGSKLENIWGQRRYSLFLLASASASTVMQFLVSTLAVNFEIAAYLPTFGATGVMYGILLACAILMPNTQVMLIIPPVPMKMKNLVIVLCAIAFAFGTWNGGFISQFGFLGGLLGAWLHIRYWRGQPPFNKRGPRLIK